MKTRSEPMNKPKVREPSRKLRSSGQYDPGSDRPRERMIAEAAYFYAERRGFAPGNEMDDWLRAEADVEGMSRSAE